MHFRLPDNEEPYFLACQTVGHQFVHVHLVQGSKLWHVIHMAQHKHCQTGLESRTMTYYIRYVAGHIISLDTGLSLHIKVQNLLHQRLNTLGIHAEQHV